MPGAENQHLEVILDAAKGIAEGDFDKEVRVDAEGIVAHLAGAINQIIHNLKEAQPALSLADHETPELSVAVNSIGELMGNATDSVLDRADAIISACDAMENSMAKSGPGSCPPEINKIKNAAFDIISAQSYQDCARQELEKLEIKLRDIRDSLVKVLVAMNLKKEGGEQRSENAQRLMKEVSSAPREADKLEQDLVDELLAEFGL